MKCLVTGAAGFIGSHLCARLLEMGHEVIGIDNFLTGKPDNIKDFADNPKFSFIKHDIIEGVPQTPAVQYIFHFASSASPPKYQQYPIETLRVNSEGTYHLLQKAKEWEARLLYASSSESYGDPKEHPQRETYWGNVNPIGPRSCYDEAKRFGEALTMAYIRKYDVDARIIRIFNTYGPRMDLDDGRVVTNFIKQALAGQPLTIYGDGTQTRSFCFISDLVEGAGKVMFEDSARGEIFNIGNSDEWTILELAEAIRKLTGVAVSNKHEPLPEDDPTRRKPDIHKISTLLGWKPTISVEDGLRQTIASFQQHS